LTLLRRARRDFKKPVSEGRARRGVDAACRDGHDSLTRLRGLPSDHLGTFCGDAEVVLANLKGQSRLYRTVGAFPEAHLTNLFVGMETTDEPDDMIREKPSC